MEGKTFKVNCQWASKSEINSSLLSKRALLLGICPIDKDKGRIHIHLDIQHTHLSSLTSLFLSINFKRIQDEIKKTLENTHHQRYIANMPSSNCFWKKYCVLFSILTLFSNYCLNNEKYKFSRTGVILYPKKKNSRHGTNSPYVTQNTHLHRRHHKTNAKKSTLKD